MDNSKNQNKKRTQKNFGNNAPNRPGRRNISDPFNLGGQEDGSGIADFPHRTIGNFNRATGYHPARPTISKEMGDSNVIKDEKPTILNMTIAGNIQQPNGENSKSQNNTSKSQFQKSKVLLTLVVVVGVVTIFLIIKGHINLKKIF